MKRALLGLRHVANAVLAASIVACASASEQPHGVDTSEPIVVSPPSVLGGGTATTRLAPSTPPSTIHNYGTGPAPSSQSSTSSTPPTEQRALPASFDISTGVPPIADQKATSSCQSWATGYSVMGWWANKVGIANARFAPMYIYSQIDGGSCSDPLWIGPALDVLQAQGIDTTSDYEPMHQAMDCATQPTDLQRANAANFKISGSTHYDLSNGAQLAIESALAGGRPAILSIIAYAELENASSSAYVVGPPQGNETSYGGHVVVGYAYDQTGVWIANSWGTGWGSSGWALLSWDFLDGNFGGGPNVIAVDSIDGLASGCSDSSPQCAAWAEASQCQENPDYMLSSCCASCANPDLAYKTYTFHTAVDPGTCLDVSHDASTDATPVDEWTCNGTPAQSFNVLNGGHGAVQLYHPHSAKCVDVTWGGTTNGTPIDIYDCNGTVAQTFAVQTNNDGSVTFTNTSSGSCVDVADGSTAKGAKIQLWRCNGTAAQEWQPIAN